jgi:hypothetical protein
MCGPTLSAPHGTHAVTIRTELRKWSSRPLPTSGESHELKLIQSAGVKDRLVEDAQPATDAEMEDQVLRVTAAFDKVVRKNSLRWDPLRSPCS